MLLCDVKHRLTPTLSERKRPYKKSYEYYEYCGALHMETSWPVEFGCMVSVAPFDNGNNVCDTSPGVDITGTGRRGVEKY